MNFQNPILVFILFVVLTISRYNETQSYRQIVSSNIQILTLSPNQDHQLMIVYADYNLNSVQQIYDFSNNSLLCSKSTNEYNPAIVWPINTGGLFYVPFSLQSSKQPLISDTICSDYRQFNQISSKGKLFKYKVRNSNNQSYLGFIASIDRQTIFQYDFQKKTIQKSITIENNYEIWDYQYSSNGQYLYVDLSFKLKNETLRKIYVYDANSYQKLRQMPVNNRYMFYQRGNNDGKSWIGAKLEIDSSLNYYNIDQDGNSLLIYTKGQEEYIKFCHDDNQTMLTFSEAPKEKTHLKVYNLTDGTIVQNFTLDFRAISPQSFFTECNNKYLSIVDVLKTAHIFQVISKPQPQPQPQPEPDNDPDSPFPTWAIIVICVVSVLVIGLIVGKIIHKRKQNISGGYKQFTNQRSKSVSYQD